MAHLQQKELDLIDYKSRRTQKRWLSRFPKIHSYCRFFEPDCPSCESPGPTLVSSEDGEACRWATLEACGLSVSLMEDGRQMPQLGCPLRPHGNLSSGIFTWYLVCLDHRWRMAFQFQTDSPMLLPLCEPLRKILLGENFCLQKILFVQLYIGVMT